MSWFRSNKPPTPSLNLRQGVADTSSLRRYGGSDLNQDASSLRLSKSTSKDRDAGSLVLGNHEAVGSLVQLRTSEHVGECMSDHAQDLLELWRQITTKYGRGEPMAIPRTDIPDTPSASIAAAPDSPTQKKIDDLLQICREMMEETRMKQVEYSRAAPGREEACRLESRQKLQHTLNAVEEAQLIYKKSRVDQARPDRIKSELYGMRYRLDLMARYAQQQEKQALNNRDQHVPKETTNQLRTAAMPDSAHTPREDQEPPTWGPFMLDECRTALGELGQKLKILYGSTPTEDSYLRNDFALQLERELLEAFDLVTRALYARETLVTPWYGQLDETISMVSGDETKVELGRMMTELDSMQKKLTSYQMGKTKEFA